MNEELEDILLDNGCDGAGYFVNPDYKDAIIGVTHDGCVAYNFEKMVECLMRDDGMDSEEAIEWIDYNVIRTIPYMGSQPPVIIYDLN